MASAPDRGPVVRVLDGGGGAVGLGVLLGPREIVTCAHVVNSALGRDRADPDQPSDEVTVTFVTGNAAPLRARVQCWRPPPQTHKGIAGDDIAGLVLNSAELPAGVTPARLTQNVPQPGRVVSVFGYPESPRRPDGAWVEATVQGEVGNGRLQLDSTTGTALRIQRGFSGSPVYDRELGRVIGLLAAAPAAVSGERDSYAITADRLRLTWPEVLDLRQAQTLRRSAGGIGELTILHVSDPQFGRNRLFGGNGRLTPADQAHDALFQRLHDDLDQLAKDHQLRPDVMVVTGDLAERGLPSEFDEVVRFLAALTEAAGLPRRHVALVPGNHDVNRRACEAYFLRQSADECEPAAPYWPKWEHFAAAFGQFYEGVSEELSFTPDEPWTLFEMPDLHVVVAGLNSTMAESHRDADHYGHVGEHQLRWFAERLARYRDQGWLRLAAVHHNAAHHNAAHHTAEPGAVTDDEKLHDADNLDQQLGRTGLVNLLLHGHTHDGGLHRLPSGLLALSTGSAAVTLEARPLEVPNQYQLLTISPSGVTRHARQYAPGQRCWIGDTRISPTGSSWQHHELHPLRHVHTTFTTEQPDADQRRLADRSPDPRPDESTPRDGFFDRVREATEIRYPGATVTPRPNDNYLRVSLPLPGGGVEQWPVGVVDGHVTEAELTSFGQGVHRQFASGDSSVRSALVYSGRPAAEDLVRHARGQGVRLCSFIDYQGLVDLRPLVARQAERLATDPIYPTELYVPQRYRVLDGDPDAAARDDLLSQVTEWLGADGARFVMVLGDFGRGKTFLLRELARTLPQHLPGLLPVLVELRNLEKAPSLDELLAQHLVRQEVDTVDVAKLRYMIRSGRLALLFDGFDELELRVGFQNAADYLHVLMREVTDHAKVVLTSRTQHFQSTTQIRTALGTQVADLAASRVAVLEDFTEQQILGFLTNHYDGNRDAAQARFTLLGDVRDLLGLSRNPRMLSFIADLDEARLRAVQAEHGQISAAQLYQELVDFWLVGEAGRHRHRGGLPSLDEQERLAACTALALRLWASTAGTIPVAELTAGVSTTLTRLAERGYTTDQAAHTIGTGTLLVRTPQGEFTFVHQSVMEWLVARAAAERLQAGTTADALVTRKMSTLMLDLLCDLAGREVARRWASDMLADPAASEVAKQNGLAITQRLDPGTRQVLTAMDLRGQDLTDRNLRNADLRGADLRGMRLGGTRLGGADLRDADFRGVRMVAGELAGAQLAGSRWHRAALLGVPGLDDLLQTPELAAAAVAGQHRAHVMIAPTGPAYSVAFSPDGTLLAVSRGHSVEIVELTSGTTLRVLTGHTNRVSGVAFSPDGALLASASWDNSVRLWDPGTGRTHHTLTGHTNGVTG
ncbi:MAG: trypsin-like peptidase domain-containing protein, partial [Pseudonocardiales bacterium]